MKPVIETVASTGSTNADMVARAKAGLGEGHWLRAERQSGGHGRLGRKWESPAGNLYCSTIVRLSPADPPPQTLAFVAGLAVYDTLALLVPDAALILKWPNDVMVADAKLCGILLERVDDAVVVGIGINVAIAPEVAGRQVIALHALGLDSAIDAARILALLTEQFSQVLSAWRANSLSATLAEWESRSYPKGTMITVNRSPAEAITGEFSGLASDGALRLRKADGALIEVHAGDVTLG